MIKNRQFFKIKILYIDVRVNEWKNKKQIKVQKSKCKIKNLKQDFLYSLLISSCLFNVCHF